MRKGSSDAKRIFTVLCLFCLTMFAFVCLFCVRVFFVLVFVLLFLCCLFGGV